MCTKRDFRIMGSLHPYFPSYHRALYELPPSDKKDPSRPRNRNIYLCWYVALDQPCTLQNAYHSLS